MSRRCQVTGKGVLSGNNVSHANNKTRTRFYPNLQSKRIWLPEEKRFVRVKLSTSALRTLDKQGNGEMLNLIRKMFA
jgi:large subunit ribosomal protein L28